MPINPTNYSTTSTNSTNWDTTSVNATSWENDDPVTGLFAWEDSNLFLFEDGTIYAF